MKQYDALILLEECLQELDSPKCSITTALNKLYRAANLIEDHEVKVWCLIYQGDSDLIKAIKGLIESIVELNENIDNEDYDQKKVMKNMKKH